MNKAAVHWCRVTAHLYEGQVFIDLRLYSHKVRDGRTDREEGRDREDSLGNFRTGSVAVQI